MPTLLLMLVSIYDAVPPQEVKCVACIIVIVGLAMADIVAK